MKQYEKSSAVVLTPTIGNDSLIHAVKSVHNQDYRNIVHLLIIDGEEYKDKVLNLLKDIPNADLKFLYLPFNTGKEKYYGHRIYAACSFLVNHDLIFYLDEDNWYDSDHVSSLVELIISQKLDWAYSLRKVYDSNETYIALDNCESLGKWPPFSGMPNLVDTSCYALRRETALKIGHAWHYQWGGDRAFYHAISRRCPNFNTSSKYSLNYRLDKNKPPNGAFFINGNKHMEEKYSFALPWKN